MSTRYRTSGAVAATVISLTVVGCSEGAQATAPTPSAVKLPLMGRMIISSDALIDAHDRLIVAVTNTEQRARLAHSIERLSAALDSGDAQEARGALAAARATLTFVAEDADRDALALALAAAAEALPPESNP